MVRLGAAAVGVAAWTVLVVPVFGQDISIVRANGPATWGPTPVLREELRIGSLMGAEEYSFGSIGDVLVHPNGTIWVGDSQLHAIRRYSSDGAYLDQVGREGEGPGEFVHPANMRVLADHSVVVWDTGLIRLSRFSADGEFFDSFTPPTYMIGGNYEELEVDPDGHLFLIAMTTGDSVEGTIRDRLLAVSRQQPRLFWLKMDLEGAVLDSVFREPSNPEGASDVLLTQTLLSPLGYRIVARNDRYAITLEKSQDQWVEIRREHDSVAYDRAERADAERMESVMSGRNGRPVRDIPRTKPPFRSVYADSQGRVWVQLRTVGSRELETTGERSAREQACEFFAASRDECDAGVRAWREGLAFDVVGPDGEYFGRIDFPNRRAELAYAADDVVWVTERGEYGEQYVVQYRIVPE